jgi:hypothetical protein
MRLATASLLLTLLASALASPCPAMAQSTRQVGRTGDWAVYAHDGNGSRICFAVSPAKSSEPAQVAGREAPHVFISGWPKDGIKAEVSIKIGYSFKKATPATVTIGPASFRLFTLNDRAFVGDATDELKLIEAMKRGSTMTVIGTPERGPQTKDTFSLQGISQALQLVAGGCQG